MLAQGVTLCCCSCCGDIGAACRRLLGSRKVTKINYLILVLGFVVPVMAITYLLKLLAQWAHLSHSQVVARMSFVLFLLFAIMVLLSLCRNRVAMVLNEGLFTVKFILVCLLFVASLFIANSFFGVYAEGARVLSLGYMLIQSIILIDIFYILGRALVKRYNQGEEQCGGILVGLSVILYGGAITLNVLSYIWFIDDGCGEGKWLNISVSVLLLLMPAVQLLQLNTQNNLLTTSLVALLLAYFSYSAQLSVPDCRTRLTPVTYLIDVISNLLLFVLATYGTISGGLSEQPQIILTNKTQSEQEAISLQQYTQTNVWVQWHGYMCLASVYLCMVFSNWLAVEVEDQLRGNIISFWARAGTCLITAILYVWTMVAPKVIPQRNFELDE